MNKRLVAFAGFALLVGLGAFVQVACNESTPAPDSPAVDAAAKDSTAPSDGGSSVPLPTSDGAVPAPSFACPAACTELSGSPVCNGKPYKEESCTRYCPCAAGAIRPEIAKAALACVA